MKSESQAAVLGSGSGPQVVAQSSSHTIIIQCPECGSRRTWKDGVRYQSHGEIQRYLCRNCGYRFSHQEGSEHSERLQKLQTLILRTKAPQPFYRNRLGDESGSGKAALTSLTKPRPKIRREPCNQHEAVNDMETRIQEQAAGATTKPIEADLKGKLVEFLFWLSKQGYSEATVETSNKILKRLIKEGADISNPESVKEAIAKIKSWGVNTKHLAIDIYTWFLEMQELTWKPPIYQETKKIPFIPTEQEIDQLISASGKTLATCLQLLKETGIRIGEALKLKWTDIDFQRSLVRITAEKNSNPRILKTSNKLNAMLNTLPKKAERVFPYTRAGIKHMFWNQRRKVAHKLQNPRFRQISFHTFRHWKGTMEYHKTKDILHVQQILGHKCITSTMLYINLEAVTFGTQEDQFHVKVAHTLDEACKLLEVGFEYVCDMENVNVKIFRKRQ